MHLLLINLSAIILFKNSSEIENELNELTEQGLLMVEGKDIVLERDGLLCVDNILHDFFLPEHRTNKLV